MPGRKKIQKYKQPGQRNIQDGRQQEKQEKQQKRAKLLESLQLPRDVCMGALRVTLTGNMEAWVENYRGLLEYTEQTILLQGKNCQICFEGRCLSIDYYTNEDMKISGCIQNVRYLYSAT